MSGSPRPFCDHIDGNLITAGKPRLLVTCTSSPGRVSPSPLVPIGASFVKQVGDYFSSTACQVVKKQIIHLSLHQKSIGANPDRSHRRREELVRRDDERIGTVTFGGWLFAVAGFPEGTVGSPCVAPRGMVLNDGSVRRRSDQELNRSLARGRYDAAGPHLFGVVLFGGRSDLGQPQGATTAEEAARRGSFFVAPDHHDGPR